MKMKKDQRVQALQRNVSMLNELFTTRGGIIMGIDPARGQIGVATHSIKKNRTRVCSYRTKANGFAKLIEIELWLEDLLGGKKICFALIEDYAYASKQGREKAGELGGIIRRFFWLRGIPLVPISVSTLKAFIGVKEKSLIVKEVLRQYGVNTNNDDESDSFLLCKLGEMLYDVLVEFSRKITNSDFSKCETHPHEYCSLSAKNAKLISNIIIAKGGEVHEFAKENEEIRKKAKTLTRRKPTKKEKNRRNGR